MKTVTVWAGLLPLLLLPAVALSAQTVTGDSSADTAVIEKKYVYLGFNVFYSPRMYSNMEKSSMYSSCGGGLAADFHFFNTLALMSGFEIAPDWIASSAKVDDYQFNIIMEVPLALKLKLQPSHYRVAEPYAGIYLNFPLYDTTSPALVAWMFGFQYGIKAGPGIFFADSRFSMDFGMSSLRDDSTTIIEHQRLIFRIGIGYKFGFFAKKKP